MARTNPGARRRRTVGPIDRKCHGGRYVNGWLPVALVLAVLALIASVAGALRVVGPRWNAVALGLFSAYAAWTLASLL